MVYAFLSVQTDNTIIQYMYRNPNEFSNHLLTVAKEITKKILILLKALCWALIFITRIRFPPRLLFKNIFIPVPGNLHGFKITCDHLIFTWNGLANCLLPMYSNVLCLSMDRNC